jgi:Tfp pilus assembly protein PilV
MQKLVNYQKNSFTLIETLLSLIIVSIIIGGFSKFINQKTNYTTYQNLQKAQNEFTLYGTIKSNFKEFTLKNQ